MKIHLAIEPCELLRAARSVGHGAGAAVFGDDHAMPDGTCVRDYVHVEDLAQAHELALGYMDRLAGAHAFNLGNGQGFSVRQVIEAARAVTGRAIDYEVAPRRTGDPPVLVASSRKARNELGWSPAWTELAPIIDSAWRWHQRQPY